MERKQRKRSKSLSPPRRRRKPIKYGEITSPGHIRRTRYRMPNETKDYDRRMFSHLQDINPNLADTNVVRHLTTFHKCLYYEGYDRYRLYTGGDCPDELINLLTELSTTNPRYLVFTSTKIKVYGKHSFTLPSLIMHFPDPDRPGRYYYIMAEQTSPGLFTTYNSKLRRESISGTILLKEFIKKCTSCILRGGIWKEKEIPRRSKGLPHGLNPAKYCFILLPDRYRNIIAEYSFYDDADYDPDPDHPRYDPADPSRQLGIRGDDVIMFELFIRINGYRGPRIR